MDQISNQIINSHLSLSSCRRFFLPYSGETSSNKSDAISAVLNHGMGLEGTFQKRMYINIPSAMLTSLLGQLVDEVQIPDDNQRIKRAVQIVGRNEGWEKEPVWVLNKSLAISRYGCQIDPAAHGLMWIGHRVQGLTTSMWQAKRKNAWWPHLCPRYRGMRCWTSWPGRFLGECSSILKSTALSLASFPHFLQNWQ